MATIARLHRQTRRDHRQRLHGRASDNGDRQGSEILDLLPANTAIQRAQRRRACLETIPRLDKLPLGRDLGPSAQQRGGVRVRRVHDPDHGRLGGRARADLRRSVAAGQRVPVYVLDVQRPDDGRGGE